VYDDAGRPETELECDYERHARLVPREPRDSGGISGIDKKESLSVPC